MSRRQESAWRRVSTPFFGTSLPTKRSRGASPSSGRHTRSVGGRPLYTTWDSVSGKISAKYERTASLTQSSRRALRYGNIPVFLL